MKQLGILPLDSTTNTEYSTEYRVVLPGHGRAFAEAGDRSSIADPDFASEDEEEELESVDSLGAAPRLSLR